MRFELFGHSRWAWPKTPPSYFHTVLRRRIAEVTRRASEVTQRTGEAAHLVIDTQPRQCRGAAAWWPSD